MIEEIKKYIDFGTGYVETIIMYSVDGILFSTEEEAKNHEKLKFTNISDEINIDNKNEEIIVPVKFNKIPNDLEINFAY